MEWTCFPKQDCRPQGTSEQVAQAWPHDIDSLIQIWKWAKLRGAGLLSINTLSGISLKLPRNSTEWFQAKNCNQRFTFIELGGYRGCFRHILENPVAESFIIKLSFPVNLPLKPSKLPFSTERFLARSGSDCDVRFPRRRAVVCWGVREFWARANREVMIPKKSDEGFYNMTFSWVTAPMIWLLTATWWQQSSQEFHLLAMRPWLLSHKWWFVREPRLGHISDLGILVKLCPDSVKTHSEIWSHGYFCFFQFESPTIEPLFCG